MVKFTFDVGSLSSAGEADFKENPVLHEQPVPLGPEHKGCPEPRDLYSI